MRVTQHLNNVKPPPPEESTSTITPKVDSFVNERGGNGTASSGEVIITREKHEGRKNDGLAAADALIEGFSNHVDVARLLMDIYAHAASNVSSKTDDNVAKRSIYSTFDSPSVAGGVNALKTVEARAPSTPAPNDSEMESSALSGKDDEAFVRKVGVGEVLSDEGTKGGRIAKLRRKTREEVEAEASKQGASGG